MFWWEPFRSGELLLPEVPSEAETVVRDIPVAGPVLVMAFVLLAMIFLRSFLNVLPYLGDSIFRERGSAALENSVRVSRDRNSIALILLIPAVLLVYRYRIYDPLFVQGLGEDLRLAAVAGVFVVYLLLRFALYKWLHPRHRFDYFVLAYRAGYTFFILLMLLVLTTTGILFLFNANDLTVKTVLLIESGVVFGIYLLRRGQILSTSCNPLTTFLYLCALEILPLSLLVITAVLL